MSDKSKKYGCDFDIEAKIPNGVYENVVAAQATLIGVHGWIETTAKGFKGQLQTENKELMEQIIKVMEKSKEFSSLITKSVFSEIKEIEKFTEETFKVK